MSSKAAALRQLNFGNQVAEEERDALREYFVRTQAWERIYKGEIDIVYGPKGSGKSALYVLVQDHTDELFDRRVLLVSAENPRGAPAFRDLVAEPPTSEREFISIWKLYFVSLIGRTIQEMGISNADAAALTEVLAANHLLPSNQTTLGAILATVRRYVAKMLNPKSAETTIGFDNSGMPNAWTGKIVFDEPEYGETGQRVPVCRRPLAESRQGSQRLEVRRLDYDRPPGCCVR